MSAPQIQLFAPRKTYGRLERSGGNWVLKDIPPHVAIRLKQIFPRIRKTSVSPFHFPADLVHAADLAWFLDRYPMEMGPADHAALEKGRQGYEREQDELERILAPNYSPPEYVGLQDGKALRGYQGQSNEVLRRRKAQLLGDEVGLGKTYSAAAACLLEGALPAFIVVEPHVQEQWKERLESFTTLSVHCVTTTKPYSLPEADVYVFRYSNVAGWVDVVEDCDVGLACWDEIQSLRRGTESAKGQACMVLSHRAKYRLGLTATPIYGYGIEIYNVMRFIDDAVLGTRQEFLREWAIDGRHLDDPDALGTYLRDQHVFIRRRRSDVGRELPQVTRITEQVAYDAKIAHSADDLARQLALKATTGAFVERGQAARELDALVRHRTGLAKAPMVADYVRILLEAGEPVVLAGWHRDVYDVWLDRLADFNPAMYTGSETARQKRESERRFLDGETDLLIMSLRSGAGLDSLQYRSQTVVFGELDWSPGIHHQLIGRLDRDREDGVVNRVMAIFLVTNEGSDPPMVEVLGLKASEAAGVTDPGLGVQRVSRDRSHLQALVRRYLDARDAA